jgi:hypothetical protein
LKIALVIVALVAGLVLFAYWRHQQAETCERMRIEVQQAGEAFLAGKRSTMPSPADFYPASYYERHCDPNYFKPRP